ncbi:hypothetical protein E4665_03100 [Sporolactobacillus shoreae]|uniref:Uncharacterized protein n=1 Tax=Sporolactobacillus shoreae TaxID=1465501 RepID=A0A4Z0GRH9_9BACL|nr:hypothetical protein [Sporolactobacillus shoreae]TGA99950.1 hypothetical protein E4665_03100 [Sporolactobacillus shoreae]
MHRTYAFVGEHVFEVQTDSAQLMNMYTNFFHNVRQSTQKPVHMTVHIHSGYGTLSGRAASGIANHSKNLIFQRDNYVIKIESSYKSSDLYVYNSRALQSGFGALYCLFITHNGWGIMFRSSYADRDGGIRITSGNLGQQVNQETSELNPAETATLVKISQTGATVFSSFFGESGTTRFPLSSIFLYHHSFQEGQIKLSQTKALIRLLDYVLYWPDDAEQTKKMIAMLKQLVAMTPSYQHFINVHKVASRLTS